MSIFDEENRGGRTRTRLFVDRHTPCREFAERLNQNPPQAVIQVYAGVGGNGKSSLLRRFRDHCCYRLPPEQWQEVRAYPDEYLVEALEQAPGARRVPVAVLDFGSQPSGMNRPQEPLSALFMIKRQLAEFDVRTPRFDFAAVSYLHRSGADVRALLAELFPRSELAGAGAVADALLQVPVIQVGTALFHWMNGKLDNLVEQRRLRRRVPPDVVAEVMALDPEPGLMDALPRFFADDLNAALPAHERIVLLFDTYEAVSGEGVRTRITGLGGPRWIRTLLRHLNMREGVVPVVAGRVAPTWSQALTEKIPGHYVKVDALGALPSEFALLYLEEAGVEDPVLREALISYTTDEPGLVHPLLLGLSTDVVLTAIERGRALQPADFPSDPELLDRERRLADRLLSRMSGDLEEAVAGVSAARSFDNDLFVHLGARLGFPTTDEVFRRLTAFSFVTPQEAGRFALHQLLRRAIANVAPELVAEAHQVLADYYVSVAQPNEFMGRIEHIYHRARLDPAAGVELWLAEMDRVLSLSRYDLCRSLLAVLGELDPPSPEAAQACDYQVARAEIALGRWEEAEARLGGLPAEAARTQLLRGELAFVRGDFAAAEHFAERALAAGEEGTARLPYLMFASNMRLFQGRFDEGRQLCREALEIVHGGNEGVLWHSRTASIEFFSGRIEAAKEQLELAARKLAEIPPDERDRQAEAGLRHEEAVVAEAEGRAEDVLYGMAEALRIRREIANARGIAHGLNGLGLAALALGRPGEAEEHFVEAARLARDLGERVLYSKVARGRAEAATLDGRFDDADRLAVEALSGFEEAAIPYDIVHAWITQARAHRARGDERGWLELADRSRREIEREGFGSLYARCPEIRPPSADRLAKAMTAFAAGDAYGVPWEGSPPSRVDAARLDSLPAPSWGWPRGSTSDDTAQMLLVGSLLADTGGSPSAEEFLARLAAAEEEIRGIGPTTRRALDHFRRTGRLPEPQPGERATNGAAMRMLPVGWSTPATLPDLRRRLTEALAIGTHRAPEAIAAAHLVAAMASWAIEGVTMPTVLAAAQEEASWVAATTALPIGSQQPTPSVESGPGAASEEPGAGSAEAPSAGAPSAGAPSAGAPSAGAPSAGAPSAGVLAVREALEGSWSPPADGIELDALTTVAAVIHVLRHDEPLGEALRRAVLLGGDTDTVAALVAGIRGAMAPQEVEELEWLPVVDFVVPVELAGELRRLRVARYTE